jgi:hypothetical protein
VTCEVCGTRPGREREKEREIESEREREREGGREGGRESEGERQCVCARERAHGKKLANTKLLIISRD